MYAICLSLNVISFYLDDLSKLEWIVYSLCIGTVVLVLGLSYLGLKYRKLKRTTKASVSDGAKIQHENEIQEESYNIYDEIDDNQITETAFTVVGKNIVTNTNRIENREHNEWETGSTENRPVDSDGYLIPCNSVQDILKEDDYSHNDSSMGSSSGSDFQFDRSCNANFLNPYHILNSNRQKSVHNYETIVTVNAVDSSLTFDNKRDAQVE